MSAAPACIDPQCRHYTCDCGRDVCPDREVSPGEGDGLCVACWEADPETEPDDDEHDTPCCPTPQYAARVLCGCWGAPGQWIGSEA